MCWANESSSLVAIFDCTTFLMEICSSENLAFHRHDLRSRQVVRGTTSWVCTESWEGALNL